MIPPIESSISLASLAHMGQKDKAGNPYIFHPLTVMMAVESLAEKTVAILHDVLEDTNITVEQLVDLGYPQEIIEAIVALTKLPGESRVDAARRTSKNILATKVKLADVAHNMDLSRLPEVTQKDMDRIAEYKEVLKILNFFEPN